MSELRRLLAFARPYFGTLLLSVVLMAAVGAMQALMALLIGPVFDRVLNPNAPDTPVLLFRLLGRPVHLDAVMPGFLSGTWQMVAFGILAVFLVKGLCDYAGNWLVNYAGFSAVTDLRQRVYDGVLRQDAHFFETNSTGSVMSSIMLDLDKIQVAYSHMMADFLRQAFTALALLGVVLQTDWKLALVSLTVLPFVLVPTLRLGKRVRRSTRSAQDDAAHVNQILQETISGQQVVKSFSAEEIESRRFRAATQKLKRSNLRYVAQQAVASPLIELFGALTIIGLLTYARGAIQAGTMSTGQFTSFVIALLMLYEPVKRLTGTYQIFQQALGASQKVFEYLDRQALVREKPGAVALERFTRGIAFENVAFRYPGAPEGFRLDSISLEVKAGEVVALVGPSGSGKTTLANLAPRFYDPAAGRILIDGVDIRDLKLDSLRGLISVVAQDTFLFQGTVARNIAYGRTDVSEARIREAARNALAEEFIQRLPEGYATQIGERGQKLSGGQRQRIAIARALLKDAPILILDEATSHLDSESERLVQKALANLMEHRTVIVIAHRLSTIRRADKIVVLEHGRIRETGTHEELVNHGGIYQRLHELQYLEPELQ